MLVSPILLTALLSSSVLVVVLLAVEL